MLFDDVVSSRRSIRRFTPQDISDIQIAQIIETARISPSAKNMQPWKFIVMRGNEKNCLADELQKAAKSKKEQGALETAEIIRKVPVLIAVYAESGERSDILSIGAAIYGMCLKATDLGLGSLWVADTDYIDSKKYENLVGAVCIGHYSEYPCAHARKPIEQISNISFPVLRKAVIDDKSPNNTQNGKYAFISYAHSDRDIIISDISEMKKHGLPLWYDKSLYSKKGEKWDRVALDNIKSRNCSVFVFYISYNSLSSKSVYKEFSEAFEKKMRGELSILPVLIGNESISSLISRLHSDGLRKEARLYRKYFGTGDSTLYVERDLNPIVLTHIEEILDYCKDKGIIPDISIYDNFNYKIDGTRCCITGYSGFSPEIEIPRMISGYPVEEIGESAFADNKVIEIVHIPDTIKKLGLAAFRNTPLKHIDIPGNVTEIDTACFRDCVNLTHIEIPGSVKILSEALFRGCTSLSDIRINEGVEELGEAVLLYCNSLKKFVLPSTIKRMRSDSIIECPVLETLVIPPETQGAQASSFDSCPMLKPTRIGKFIFAKGGYEIAE